MVMHETRTEDLTDLSGLMDGPADAGGLEDLLEQLATATPRARTPQEVLGVRPGAPLAELRAAHRRLLIAWHPDRFADRDDASRAEAAARVAEAGEAYHTLLALRRR